ncbi:MAG: ribonuclease R [Acidobacteria bacterium]|nr:ribonuclease R [Acidobacteriota bacterium]
MNTASVLTFLRSHQRPVALKALIRHFDLDVDERRQLKRWLEDQVAEGNLQRVRKNLYSAHPPRTDAALVSGRLSTHRDGYGFVIPDERGRPDIFVPPSALGSAVHGDKVQVRVSKKKRGGRLEGQIVDVLTRSQERVVGKLFRHGRRWMVAPLDERYHYTIEVAGRTEHLQEGQIVNLEIVAQPKRYELPVGRVDAVLGFPDDPEIQFKIVCYKNQIPMEFPAEVLEEVEGITPPGLEEISLREDLRELAIVTIDGETARDFDDAVSIERRKDDFVLGVHIADVSHYVLAEGAIDREAFLRGTSVYFPDRAVPMLPERLSNDLCSLRPREDRLTVSVFMRVDAGGRVSGRRFSRSVIRSRARMTYNDVHKILEGDPVLCKRYQELVPHLRCMLDLSRILAVRRGAKGAIDFDLPEAEIEYDVNGKVFDIVRSERNQAHRLIEEFMLLANETVAGYLSRRKGEVVYRVHEEPDPLKASEFARLARQFGYRLEGVAGRYTAMDFQRLAESMSGKPEERFLSYLMLRSFKQARYSVENVGHFGLALHCYTHFTSPIRRYPDLVVHRLLKRHIVEERKKEPWEARLDHIAEQSSDRERKADEAEREIMKWLMAVFMSQRLGETYEGFVSGVRPNGFYVELLDHFVEGFVHVSKLADDYYFFDERSHRLVGENSGRMFRLGDRLGVLVDKVDRDRHLIEFALAGEALPAARLRRPQRPSRKSGSRRRR